MRHLSTCATYILPLLLVACGADSGTQPRDYKLPTASAVGVAPTVPGRVGSTPAGSSERFGAPSVPGQVPQEKQALPTDVISHPAGAGHQGHPADSGQNSGSATGGSSSSSSASSSASGSNPPPPPPAPAPVLLGGNPKCADLGVGSSEVKLDSVLAGEYKVGLDEWYLVTVSGGSVTVEGSLSLAGVIVKAGPAAHLYQLSGGLSVSGLAAPINPNNGKPYGISHLSLCLK